MTASRHGHPETGRWCLSEGECERCASLCCVALPYSAGWEFARSKRGGEPCHNLEPRYRCAIHHKLLGAGFPGCVNFDCHGAGQHITNVTFVGGDWQRNPSVAEDMFSAFRVAWPLFELRSFAEEAVARCASLSTALPPAHDLSRLIAELTADLGLQPSTLAGLNVRRWREKINPYLDMVSRALREAAGGLGRDLRGADLAGSRYEGSDLARANLRGTVLTGANLRRADLRGADVTGADLRGADIRGADLRGVLFLRKSQLHGARGDKRTLLSRPHRRPPQWGR